MIVSAVQADLPGKSAATTPPEKKACRRVETTGSIMPGRSVCHTRAEWAQIDDANAAATAAARERQGSGGMGAR